MHKYPITGIAVRNGLGVDVRAVGLALHQNVHGLKRPSVNLPFDTWVGELDPCDLLPPCLRAYDSQLTRLAASVFDDIAASVHGAIKKYGADRVGIVLGTSTAGMPQSEEAYAHVCKYGDLLQDFSVWTHHAYHGLIDVIAAISGARGPAYVVSTACTSSAKVFGSAERMMKSGSVDAVLVGGADVLCRMTMLGFHSLGILSETRCRPFCAERDGINIGEGAAFLLLECEGEGRAYYASIGETSDAYHMSSPHPEGRGAIAALHMALDRAGIAAEDVDCISAHGTGTPLNDQSEAIAIRNIWPKNIPVVATKALTGHLLGAAAANEAVLAILGMEQSVFPGMACADVVLDPALGLDVVRHTISKNHCNVVSNSFAFGGSNAVIVLTL